MRITRTQNLIAAALGCAVATLALPVAAQEREQDKWQFQIAPYLWAANVNSESSLPQSMTTGSPSVQRFDTSLSAGLMLAAEARYRSVGVLANAHGFLLGVVFQF